MIRWENKRELTRSRRVISDLAEERSSSGTGVGGSEFAGGALTPARDAISVKGRRAGLAVPISASFVG
jgi:hypothetical protein